ncbi:MAG: DMT family transporter [Tepidimonas ignava]|uniref:EamA-like transporter family protein n=1 Tax=Tepidimonas ignava TaxID=114249 RepID=A0A4R3LI84_9BURK|nr:DMT family transporter [Tepidimonas ignava]MCX7815307.1 DMT family transporter [Tepidimonas ignava]TCS99899.1 S-adenosylmethionine uptake transporter [Tepidimonas ignava]TSE23284.1 EamA-like transporter family protein [Tepidimonas ignava]
MVLGAALFATMGVCIKKAAPHFHSFEIVGYRGLIGAVLLALLARQQGVALATRVPAMHLWRSAVGTVSLLAWFYAIATLPLPTAMTLNYMSSVWVAAFLVGGSLLLQRPAQPLRQQGPLLATVLVGFAGVALVLRPSFEGAAALGGLSGLLSGLTSALAYLQVAALARAGEPETRTVFWFSVAAAVVGFMGTAVLGASAWVWPQVVWLLPIGVLAMLGQLCMTRAYASGATLVVANLQYFGIAFAALYGLLLFDDRLPWQGWLGMLLIVASGVAATLLRERAVPRLPAEEHA